MFNSFKRSTIAIALMTAVAAPMTAANAQQTATTNRVQELPASNGMTVQAATPTQRTMTQTPTAPRRMVPITSAPRSIMAIRNDGSNARIQIPSEYNPPVGKCRLWYPDRPVTTQPGLSNCNAPVPRGAIKLMG